MQLTTFIPCLAALAAVDGQFYPPHAGQQFYQQQQFAPPQQYPPQWRQYDQPTFQQPQPQFLPQQPVQNFQQQGPFMFPQQQQRFPLPQFQQQAAQPPQQFMPQDFQVQQFVQQQQPQQFQLRNISPPQPQFQHQAQVFQQPPPPPQPQPVQQVQQVQQIPAPQKPYKEGPRIFEQQFRVSKPMSNERFPPQPIEPQLSVHQRIRVPSPPERFHPHLADIYFKPLPDRPHSTKKPTIILIGESLPEGAYGAEEKLDGHHPSYIENTARTTPVEFRRVIQTKAVIQRPSNRRPAVQRPQPQPQLQPQARIGTTRAPVVVAKPQPIVIPAKSVVIPPTTAKSANAVFLSCCKATKVAKSCERICNFDILNKKTLTGMFLGTDPCPQSYGLDLLQCAAQSDDHTACCRERGVHTTTAGEKCLGFCNMKPGANFQADVSMLPCWGVLNDIKSCFKDSIESKL